MRIDSERCILVETSLMLVSCKRNVIGPQLEILGLSWQTIIRAVDPPRGLRVNLHRLEC
jgi:hypothetical protein